MHLYKYVLTPQFLMVLKNYNGVSLKEIFPLLYLFQLSTIPFELK